MEIKIRWHNGVVQTKKLVHCKTKQGEINMNSLIYKAIADGSFVMKTDFGDHPFELIGNR